MKKMFKNFIEENIIENIIKRERLVHVWESIIIFHKAFKFFDLITKQIKLSSGMESNLLQFMMRTL